MASLAKRFKKLIAPKKLETELAVATEFGPRHATFDPVASGMVPERLAAILREAVDGDPHEFLGFAEEMEERDAHYRSVIGTRKRALSGIEPIVTAASEDAGDTTIADAVREHLVEVPQFNGLVEDALDGLGKGFAVVEMMWRTDLTPWCPREYVWRDPRFFQFDRVTRREIRLREQGSNEGVELAPYKYIVHVPRLKSGLPIRGGLARLAAWSFMIKSFAVKDWAAFAEGYGMPIRVGRYGPNATEDDKRTLLRALRQIAADM
ncbi:MAG: phage portal protein family protein, partial [Alphaproteobacteria bacterium]